MSTPNASIKGHVTPTGSGRHKSVAKTPKSVLTPNDDAAEKASVRRKRRSDALRLSLSDAFAGQSDQQHAQQQPGGASNSSSARPTLSDDARNALLEQCLKLATENKISDRNAWHLDLITHLPDIVSSSALKTNTSGYNFQKISGGLDAGVTIYSKRVDLTYKALFDSLRGCGPSKQGDDQGDDGCGDDGDDIEDAAAVAAKAQKQKGRGSRQQGAADEANTLTTPEHLRQKKGDTTFAVDPLFHTMSALFDEGGARGLLLLNRSAFDGAHIMTSPHGVPEQHFSLQPQQQQDVLLDLKPLQQQLAACSQPPSSTAAVAGTHAAVLTPALQQLYELLEQTNRALPGQKQQQQGGERGDAVDVASIMQQATRHLPPTPMPKPPKSTAHCGQTAAAAAAAGGTGSTSSSPSNAAAAAAGDAAGGTDMADACACADVSADSAAGAAAADDIAVGDCMRDGPCAGGVPVVASFLASCAAADDEDAAAAAARDAGDKFGGADYGPDGGYGDDDGADDGGHDHPGFRDGGQGGTAEQGLGPGWSQQQQQQQGEQRRASLLGLGSDQGPDDAAVLDAEALQQLLGGAAGGARKGGPPGTTTTGSGWAGSRFWKYRVAAAAVARMASGGGDAVKRASAAAQRGRTRSAAHRIEFTSRQSDISAALAAGSRRQTCLVTPPSSTADTLLPEDLHYQASSLLQLFLRPTPISFARQQQHQQQGGSSGDQQLPSWAEEGVEGCGDGDDGGGWGGGEGYGGDDYDDDLGADGYNAGDLSMGDPGFSHHPGAAEGQSGAAGDGGGSVWWSSEGELLSAPKRNNGRGVNYTRSAKQVDVRALKDILWDSLVNVNQQHTNSSSTPPPSPAAGAAAGGPVIPFQDVIVAVPHDSAAGQLSDVSVHMCFICLLHLANEKGLVVRGQDDLRTLTIGNVQQEQ